MSISFKLKSHPHQLLIKHVQEVASIAINTHRSHAGDVKLEDLIQTTCMCHDFGKGTTYFQDYLEKEYSGELKNHSLLSALLTYWMLPDKWKHLGFLVVKKHHGSIKDCVDEFDGSDDWTFNKQIEDIKKNHIEELNHIYGVDLAEFFNWLEDEKSIKEMRRDFRRKKFTMDEFVLLQYVYSLLLSSDKNQLILGCAYIPEKTVKGSFVDNYLKKVVIDTSIRDIPGLEDTEIFELRNDVYAELCKELDKIDLHKEKRFSINLPTGIGKTMLAYKAAFYVAEKIHKLNCNVKPSVIYCLPFMSVIDQNSDVMRALLKHNLGRDVESDELLKFHSMAEIEYKDFESFDARFCFENWQSEITITTFVQLFNTIFKAGKNSAAHRFHKLSNAVVVLDEVQTINSKYFAVIKDFFEILADRFNMRIILLTATMPMIFKTKELIPNKEYYFKSLNRIELHNFAEQTTNIDDFKDIIMNEICEKKDKSFLVVLNTVKSSLEIYNHLKDSERELIYLSAEIYPKLRLNKIKEIRTSKKKYVVVSTQLIEAGVDIDLDIVYRDFAPLDSINQTAGRANRNGIASKGLVYLYELVNEDDRKYCSFVYPRPLLKATKNLLEGKTVIQENEFFEINQKYFEEINKIKSDDVSNEMLRKINKLELEKFRNLFELIENDSNYKTDLIVNANKESAEILDILRGNEEIESVKLKNLFRKLNKYRILIPKKEINNINSKEISKYAIKYVELDAYSGDTGVIRKSLLEF
ncbi:MAG: CRISPR-associated helicase Cas3' [Clostridiales bacterium]|nr:CRISPR-associated helicase Cas3' [Clostridiales bacterium]